MINRKKHGNWQRLDERSDTKTIISLLLFNMTCVPNDSGVTKIENAKQTRVKNHIDGYSLRLFCHVQTNDSFEFNTINWFWFQIILAMHFVT